MCGGRGRTVTAHRTFMGLSAVQGGEKHCLLTLTCSVITSSWFIQHHISPLHTDFKHHQYGIIIVGGEYAIVVKTN